jgi:hypothetical protein
MRDYEIEPEPEPDVAAAIVQAFERLAADEDWNAPPGDPGSPWRARARAQAVDPGVD